MHSDSQSFTLSTAVIVTLRPQACTHIPSNITVAIFDRHFDLHFLGKGQFGIYESDDWFQEVALLCWWAQLLGINHHFHRFQTVLWLQSQRTVWKKLKIAIQNGDCEVERDVYAHAHAVCSSTNQYCCYCLLYQPLTYCMFTVTCSHSLATLSVKHYLSCYIPHCSHIGHFPKITLQSSRVTTYPVYNVSTVITYFFPGPDFT